MFSAKNSQLHLVHLEISDLEININNTQTTLEIYWLFLCKMMIPNWQLEMNDPVISLH